ncbi:STAS domain-containing protein [Neptuniibacter halophilus]|uniref:STAS domain-containing protein n=1 Tax=Neptuniibacter halophilus TaxID=651666 RepID=UPI002573D730|nr:STAS domain-containing protein [Neptuniibacter halophilus]
MTISVNNASDSKTVNINVSQQFDYSLHQGFRDAYRNVSAAGTTFKVDLSKATYMDSSALGMILLLKEHAEKLGGRVIISKPNESVRKILMIANFDQFVTIEN